MKAEIIAVVAETQLDVVQRGFVCRVRATVNVSPSASGFALRPGGHARMHEYTFSTPTLSSANLSARLRR